MQKSHESISEEIEEDNDGERDNQFARDNVALTPRIDSL
jgi:hypothetical protein